MKATISLVAEATEVVEVKAEDLASSVLTSDLSKLQKIILGRSVVADLHSGVCSFTFVKENGEVRIAHGTLKPELLDSLHAISAEAGAPNQQDGISVNKKGDVYTRYYDLNKEEWRSFRWDRLVAKF